MNNTCLNNFPMIWGSRHLGLEKQVFDMRCIAKKQLFADVGILSFQCSVLVFSVTQANKHD